MVRLIEMKSSMKYLIVDHIDGNPEALMVNLKKMGYRNVNRVRSGYEALNFIKRNHVEFMIVRMKLYDMAGIELFDEMKNDLTIDRIPFLMFSEEMDQGDLALILEAGVDAHLTIPFVAKSLAAKVTATWSRYIDPNNIEYHFEMGRRALLEENNEKAMQIFHAIAKSGKITARALTAVARTMFVTKDLEGALPICERVIQEYPHFIHAHQLMGEVYLELDQPVEALGAFSKALELSPKNPIRYQIISEILLNMKLWEQAREVLVAAEAQGISLNFVEEGLAKSNIQLGEVDVAIKYYEKLVKRNPETTSYLNNIAICYKKLKNSNKAIEFYNKALKLDNEDNRIRYNLALVFLDRGKESTAIKKLQEILDIEPEHQKAKLKLLQINDPEAYKSELKKVKEEEKKERLEAEAAQAKAQLEVQDALESSQDDAGEGDLDGELEDQGPARELSESEAKALDQILNNVKQLKNVDESNKVPSLKLSENLKSRIKRLTDEEAEYQFISAMKGVRKQQYQLLRPVFKALTDISEEIVGDISGLADEILKAEDIDFDSVRDMIKDKSPEQSETYQKLKAAFDQNAALKDDVMPILMGLQFQDYLAQALSIIQDVFKITYDVKNQDQMWEKVEQAMVTEDDKSLFRKVVLGIEPDPEDAGPSGGDVLLF